MLTDQTPASIGADTVTLLRDLFAAGWRHSYSLNVLSRDEDGAPWADTPAHEWRRGPERIESCSDWLSHQADTRLAGEFVTTDREWVERHGVAGLRRLAMAVDILPTSTPEGAA